MGWASRPFTALLLLTLVAAPGRGLARADEGSGASSTDAVAKQRQDEFEELQKKKTSVAANARLEILKGLAFAPCPTARRFVSGLLKKASTPGDERVVALQTLLHIADESTFELVLATLAHDKDPTLWQVFGESLGAARSEPVRTWLKGPALGSRDVSALGAVLDDLAARQNAALLERIEELYAKHSKAPGSAELASRALRALATAKGAAALPALLEATRHADVRMRLVAADVLPGLEPFTPEIESAVRGLLADESATVKQAVAIRLGATKRSGQLLASLIACLADPRLRTRHVARVALEQITGQHLGNDPKAWSLWMATQAPGKAEPLTLPSYHGFSVETDRVVFLVDCSSSMTWPWTKEPHRIDVARAELASVLKQLTPTTQFNVLVFSDELKWFRKTEQLAAPENIEAAVAWAEKALATPKGDTQLFEALEAAFASDPEFDTIFLLTDGNPTSGKYWSTSALVASVRAWNRHRRAAIHTVGLSLADLDRGSPNLAENPALMTALLSSLAAATAGEYREILTAAPVK